MGIPPTKMFLNLFLGLASELIFLVSPFSKLVLRNSSFSYMQTCSPYLMSRLRGYTSKMFSRSSTRSAFLNSMWKRVGCLGYSW